MKAIAWTKYRSQESLRLLEVDEPVQIDDEVIIKIPVYSRNLETEKNSHTRTGTGWRG